MIRYSEYRPTAFDTRGLALDTQQHWLVMPVIQTRDSETLEQSNFASALEQLGGESESVQVHRFGHWANGWFEIIIIDPADESKVQIAESIESTLKDYPILDDEDLSRRENDEYEYAWEHHLPSDFAHVLGEHFGLSEDTVYAMWGDMPLKELYEELLPSGDWWEANGMCSRMKYAAENCTRERLAAFLKQHRPKHEVR
jgi:hypothetical protein